MTANLFTAVQKRGDFNQTIHLAKLKSGKGWVPACGTRANDTELLQGVWPQHITCDKCRKALFRDGILPR